MLFISTKVTTSPKKYQNKTNIHKMKLTRQKTNNQGAQ